MDKAESLADLPPALQSQIVADAEVVELDVDEETTGFGVLLVLSGGVSICATVNDAAAARFGPGALVSVTGTFEQGVAVRAIANSPGTRVATWDGAALREALESCPWVAEEIDERGDRLQAHVGATLGPLGDLDEQSRSGTLQRLLVRVLAPAESFLVAGTPGTGIYIIGGGTIEISGDGARETLGCGDPLFASAGLGGGAAPANASAGSAGALVLVADRTATQELITTYPTLLEMLASS